MRCSKGWSGYSGILVSYVVVNLLCAYVKGQTPIQIRISPFWILLRSTEPQSPLSLPDVDAIHWDAEDVVEAYVRSEYRDSPETDFHYSALALVKEVPELATNTTTGLQFSGGVAYFGGDSRIFPTQSQFQELVEAALDPEGQLLSMLHESGYVSFTSIAFGSGTYDPNLAVAGLTLGDTTAVVEEVATLGMVMIVSTTIVGLVILCCVVLVVFSMENQKRRQAHLDGVPPASTHESSFDDEENIGESGRKQRKRGKQMKELSLHQLDSLKENEHASISETSSNNVEQLLQAAVHNAELALRDLPSSDSESSGRRNNNQEDEQTINNKSNGSNDSTASMDIEDHGSLGNAEVVGCQEIQPKVVPVNKFTDHFHDLFDFSFMGSAAPKEGNEVTKEPIKPEKTKSKSIQDAILKCCVMPFSDSSLPSGNNPKLKSSQSDPESPISAVTEKTLQLDEAERFSTVSSGYKTDDFSPDEHWDPDDNSVGIDDGVDAFSPLTSPSSAGGESDKAELLKYPSKSKYELTPLRTSPPRPSTRIPYNIDL